MKTYFVSDVHLGLKVGDPADRERRFSDFLLSLPEDTESVYLLGDIWDFWYEYKHVVPKGYVRVLSALQNLMDRGVNVFFFQGNHDVWTYSYFEELGMKKLVQPYVVEIDGKRFCLGHGDGLGPVPFGYRFLRGLSIIQWPNSCSVFFILGWLLALATAGQRATDSRMSRNMCSRVQMSLW